MGQWNSRSTGKIFQKKRLWHYPILEHPFLRILILILTWISIAFTLSHLLWPVTRPFLKEGVTWITLFLITFIASGLVIFPLGEFLSWLFPYFEFEEVSLPRRIRK